MILAGIVGCRNKSRIAGLIHSLLSATGKKVSVMDSSGLSGLDRWHIRNYINELEKNHTDILLIKLEMEDLCKDEILPVHLDIVIYSDGSPMLIGNADGMNRQNIRKIFSCIDDKAIAIVNADDAYLSSFLNQLESGHVLTYGFNSKAALTTSSVCDVMENEKFMCCLQEKIPTSNGKWMEPQEYKFLMETKDTDPYNVLAAAAFAVVNGVDLNHLSD